MEETTGKGAKKWLQKVAHSERSVGFQNPGFHEISGQISSRPKTQPKTGPEKKVASLRKGEMFGYWPGTVPGWLEWDLSARWQPFIWPFSWKMPRLRDNDKRQQQKHTQKGKMSWGKNTNIVGRQLFDRLGFLFFLKKKDHIFQVGFKLNRTTTSLQLVLGDVSKEKCKGLELSIHHPKSHRSSGPFVSASR